MGLEMQVASAIMPTLIIWASIWLNPPKEPPFARGIRDENPCSPGDRRRLHDIARPQDELINPSVDASTDRHSVQIDLGCRQLRLRARFLRWQDDRKARLDACLVALAASTPACR